VKGDISELTTMRCVRGNDESAWESVEVCIFFLISMSVDLRTKFCAPRWLMNAHDAVLR